MIDRAVRALQARSLGLNARFKILRLTLPSSSMWVRSSAERIVDMRTTAWRVRLVLIAVSALAFVIGSIGITSEASALVGGDEARYLMNGVYLLDLTRDRPFANVATLLDHARLYYARYPALSLGHHPPLLPLAEAATYALFGVSVHSARLVTLLSFIAASAFLLLFIDELYGLLTALFFSLITAALTIMQLLSTAQQLGQR